MKRDFKGIWIPKEIWLDKNLTYFEKAVYAEIDSLCGDDGCFASNKYFAEFFECSERNIRYAITHLRDLGLIETIACNGRKRVIRTLRKNISTEEKYFRSERKNISGQSGKIFPSLNSYNKDYNKDYISSSDDDDKNNVVVVVDEEKLKKSIYDCLFSEEQEEKIFDELTLDEIDYYCKKLSEWKKKNPGKTCRSDYKIIMQWAKEDRQTEG